MLMEGREYLLRLRLPKIKLAVSPAWKVRNAILTDLIREDLAMTVLRLVLLISLVALTAMGQQNSPQRPLVAPASCPVTVPPADPFKPPRPYSQEVDENLFRLGTERLWTTLEKAGVCGHRTDQSMNTRCSL